MKINQIREIAVYVLFVLGAIVGGGMAFAEYSAGAVALAITPFVALIARILAAMSLSDWTDSKL
ncbi:hypothetical protein [Pseudomonas syringae]|uniref:hypothetical protein n=1 Tax=Pseudomonas syringae TaxID=317 RepID=UPI00245FCD05|nr:hypothetical protein [Pseudomonas syringae]MDH4602423.1 hypothetical protein [Pseudomonas syringae pv. papulans]